VFHYKVLDLPLCTSLHKQFITLPLAFIFISVCFTAKNSAHNDHSNLTSCKFFKMSTMECELNANRLHQNISLVQKVQGKRQCKSYQ
jgi:hypothetical protein